MIGSLLSPYKDVVHILPVKTIKAEYLFFYIKKIICGLEGLGFDCVGVVSDNNSINRKAMSYFENPPKLCNIYQNPYDNTKPMFFIIDTVHILKNIRNNWLNQKPNQVMKFPNFNDDSIHYASFNTLKEMHNYEKENLLKYGYKLSLKALYPTSIERQNVKLALQIFNRETVNALNIFGSKNEEQTYFDTATYIEIIRTWWDIVNVKTFFKGKRLRNIYEEPITKESIHIQKFLNDFLIWLEKWELYNEGKITKETHHALHHSTDALIKLSKYCLEKKNFAYSLCGKVQTDKLEDRFGKYRQHAGAQYHVSIRQIFETESKLRMQSVLPMFLKSQKFGDLNIDFKTSISNEFIANDNFDMNNLLISLKNACIIDDTDINNINKDTWPLISYVAGYAAYSANKTFKCEICKKFLINNYKNDTIDYSLININNRGGLCYPTKNVVIYAAYMYILIKNLLDNEIEFLEQINQLNVVYNLFLDLYEDIDIDVNDICTVHNISDVVKKIAFSLINLYLNIYIKIQNNFMKKNNVNNVKRKIN